MNPLVFHLVSGDAFYTGVGCFLIAALLGFKESRKHKIAASLLFFIGAILIVFSTTPIPIWSYVLLLAMSVAWLIAIRRKVRSQKKFLRVTACFIIGWVGAAIYELSWTTQTVKIEIAQPTLIVIGDSVSSGIDDDERTWPQILAEKTDINLVDLSEPGAKTGDMLNSVTEEKLPAGLVVIEIGGNDLFSETTAEEFARDLDALLEKVSGPERQIVMFGLPLPPLQFPFGWAQRELAKKHGVTLIPRRVFLSLLAEENATLDSIHLSPSGHERMAEFVQTLYRVKSE